MNTVSSFTTKDVRNNGKKIVDVDVTAYAIQDDFTGLYFIWCYTNEDFANKMANTVSPGSPEDRAANWRARRDQLSLSNRTDF